MNRIKSKAVKRVHKKTQRVCKPVTKSQKFQPGRKDVNDKDKNIGLSISDLLDALPFYVMLVSADHRILQANNAVQKQLGLDPSNIIGKYCPEAIHGLQEPWYAAPSKKQ